MQVKIGPALHIDEIIDLVKKLPHGVRVVFMRAFVTYIIGNQQHGLKHEPAYKYVSRKSAYGETFVSDKQRRWFWANGGPDMIGDNRTHAISQGWVMNETSDWSRVTASNKAPGVGWVMGDEQARQPAMVGWRHYMKVIGDNAAGAFRSGLAAVHAWIESRGRTS